VARDLGEAEQPTLLVAHGIDHRQGPETRTVLAQTPALALVTPLLAGDSQRPFRNPGLAVFRGKELRIVPADDLLCRIALDAGRPGFPAGAGSAGIEHEDGVVGDALDEQPEVPLGVA